MMLNAMYWCLITYLREASAPLLVPIEMGNAKASIRGSEQQVWLSRFFYSPSHKVSLVALNEMIKKISDTDYLQSYFEEKYDVWFLSKPKDRKRIENTVCDFVEHNLDGSIYLQANGGLASGLCSYPHFEDDLKKIISILKELNSK